MINYIKQKKLLSAGIMLIVAFSLTYITLKTQIAESKENSSAVTDSIPTVFVHGYKGTYNSFKTMLYRFEENKWAKREMVAYVSAEGKITWKGNIPSDSKLPAMIQVVFENNKASIAETSSRLQNVMKELKSTYGISRVNLVGHSMGGLVSTHYLQTINGSSEYPETGKLAVIGSPFNGIDDDSYHRVNTGEALIDLKPGSAALADLAANRTSFPAETEVLAIAGSGDQVVEVQSAYAIDRIVDEDMLKKQLIKDKNIDHSGLHETEKVDKLLKKFLW